MAEERGGGRDDFVPCLKGKEAFGWMLCVGSEKVAKHMLRTQLVLVRSMCLVGRLLFVSELAFEVFCGLFVLFFGLRVKYTPEIGFNLLKFIPLYHIIRL